MWARPRCSGQRTTSVLPAGGSSRSRWVRPTDIGEAELGYLLLPEAWGLGYAAEACAAALGWFADARPGESVVERYEGYGAEQWLGVWPSVAR